MDIAELRDAVRGLLAQLGAPEHPAGSLWDGMVEAGWLALGVSGESGGLGQPMPTVAALLEEVGRRPCAQPLISATVAAMMLDRLARAGCAPAGQVLDEALNGRAVVVCGSLDPLQPVELIPHAGIATHLLTVAHGPDRRGVVMGLAHTGVDVRVEAIDAWDPTRQYGRVVQAVQTSGLPLRVASAAETERIAVRGRAALDLAVASDSLGGASQILETTVAYMKQRVQFGRPIAAFQALKHRCADLATELAAVRATLARACTVFDDDAPEPAILAAAALARAVAGAAYCTVAEEALQLHGGIGFTWEHACHRYLKRARSAETIGGSRAARLDRVADSLIGGIHADR